MNRAVLPGALVALCLLARAAHAREESLGVIIVPMVERDSALADNLTEVAMAKIGETPGRRLVGAAELRRRAGGDAGQRLHACLERPACLGSVGVSLGVSRIVTGAIRTEDRRFLLSLSLTDIAASRVDAQLFKQVDGDLGDLIRAVQDGIDELFSSKNAYGRLRVTSEPEGARVVVDDVYVGSSPLLSQGLVPGLHRVRVEPDRHFPWKSTINVPPGGEIDLRLGSGDLLPRHTWAPPIGYGTAAGAAICLAAGGVFGALANITPSGQTRQETQADLERRVEYGHIGTALWVSGAALGATSAVIFYRYWRDIVGN